ncbi:Peptidyl-prolyl isomerase cwc27 [Elasticomyces elasticus]|nr:Peptidyl-prolyl isomerase cwc27 [Elasticomyces elasticus]
MSSLYNLEPQPTAKVLLSTTLGDISLELFAKQTPLASRNFIQHCLDGYYTNTVFHRLVPGFILQGGDPTGTGSGGVSALYDDGRPFEDEFHSRLRFNRRGLLGMANGGGKNDNGSQFFLTLGETKELQGKHTMFGRVEGDTIYNLMKMGEAELAEEGGDRPTYPVRITGTEVLVNPFEGMAARIRIAERTQEEKAGPKKKRKVGKQLLSFGGDEGDEEAPKVVKKAKFNPKLVSAREEDVQVLDDVPKSKAPHEAKKKVGRPGKRRESSSRSASPPTQSTKPRSVGLESPSRPAPSSPEPEPVAKTTSLLEETNAQIAALKASMKRDVMPRAVEQPNRTSALEAMIPATSTRGRKRAKGGDDESVLDLFNSFKKRLEDMPEPEKAPSSAEVDTSHDAHDVEIPANGDPSGGVQMSGADDEEAALCDLHFIANCQSCRAWDDPSTANLQDADDDIGTDWMAHSLTFAKDRLGKSLEWKRKNEEELEVIDPREKAKEIKQRGRVGREKDGGGGAKEWDKGRGKLAVKG